MENTLFFYDRVRLLFLSLTEPQHEIRHLSLTSLLVESHIGIRLLDEHTFIFRVISSPLYFSLVDKEQVAEKALKSCGEKERQLFGHFKELSGVYEAFMEKRPIEVEKVNAMGGFAREVW